MYWSEYCEQCHWAKLSIAGCSSLLQQPEHAHASRTCTVIMGCEMYHMMESMDSSSSYHPCNAAPPCEVCKEAH
jgi:hypothetical protein